MSSSLMISIHLQARHYIILHIIITLRSSLAALLKDILREVEERMYTWFYL